MDRVEAEAGEVAVDWSAAALECDVVMKGGIASGVVYPRALTEFAKTYRFRGVGGASAGAIGAAFAAAAEFGRDKGGFNLLEQIPAKLGNGALKDLFQPQDSTAALLPILLEATAPGAAGVRWRAILGILCKRFPLAGILGSVWGGALILLGVVAGVMIAQFVSLVAGAIAGLIVVLSGLMLLAVGWLVGVGSRVINKLTVSVPENMFGICRGLSEGNGPGLTDWLSERIDELAGLTTAERPLTFGQLWGTSDPTAETNPALRKINLLMVTSCLSRTRPYEMPWDARNFFYDPADWDVLFPPYIMSALASANSGPPPGSSAKDSSEWTWITQRAENQGLRRLPSASDLPVVVATRMSLSFPLLISAIPLKSVNFRSKSSQEAIGGYRNNMTSASALAFETLWFTDGGLCSNFPLHMFDAPLPTRPTFGINLGHLPDGAEASQDQLKNIDWAKDNRDGLLPTHRPIAESGAAAVKDFTLAALDMSRNWQDNSYLDVPGYRDRIVRVLHSDSEGGLNLSMDPDTLAGLADRGRIAARAMVEQFTEPRYANEANGWANHRWVRYRALLAGMPDFLRGFRAGREALNPTGSAPLSSSNPPVNTAAPPGYKMTGAGLALADVISSELYNADAAVAAAAPATVAAIRKLPRAGRIRRIPSI